MQVLEVPAGVGEEEKDMYDEKIVKANGMRIHDEQGEVITNCLELVDEWESSEDWRQTLMRVIEMHARSRHDECEVSVRRAIRGMTCLHCLHRFSELDCC